MTRLCCVTYVDSYSINNDAYQDFLIGAEQNRVGCNHLSFSKSVYGDLVLINAKRKEDHKKYAMIVKITEPCDEQIWKERGGNKWSYIFKCEPLTPMFVFEGEISQKVEEWCEKLSLNRNILFNSRFCSKKFIPIVMKMIELFESFE